MTPEMSFDCLLVSDDPAVVCTIDPILQELSICTSICQDPKKAAGILSQVSTDLVIVDLDKDNSIDLVNRICSLQNQQKPTMVAVSAGDQAIPGVHILLRKPVTPESGLSSLRRAYSRMLQDFRKYTRFALMMSVNAVDEDQRTIPVIVTNIGQGGLGFTTKQRVKSGNILSMRIPLPGLGSEIQIRARVVWTRDYGASGCAFVHLSPFDSQLLNAWLESKYRIKKPLIPVDV
ncbi:MAG: PilZ domain-containing protein [Candidatus Sulfotelmatobacter sp.]